LGKLVVYKQELEMLTVAQKFPLCCLPYCAPPLGEGH